MNGEQEILLPISISISMSKPLKYFVILNVLCLLIGFALVLIKSRHAAVQADIMQQGLDLLKEIVERRHPR